MEHSGVYVNFLGRDDGQDRVKAAYGADKYDRHVQIKNKYGPANRFRMNQHVVPTA